MTLTASGRRKSWITTCPPRRSAPYRQEQHPPGTINYRQGYRNWLGQAHQHHPSPPFFAWQRAAGRKTRRSSWKKRLQVLAKKRRRHRRDELPALLTRVLDAFVKIDVPASWPTRSDAEATTSWPATPPPSRWSRRSVPVDKMDGDSLPPASAFVDHVGRAVRAGQASAMREARRCRAPERDVTVRAFSATSAYVCPHATIRPFVFSAEEAAAAPLR